MSDRHLGYTIEFLERRAKTIFTELCKRDMCIRLTTIFGYMSWRDALNPIYHDMIKEMNNRYPSR